MNKVGMQCIVLGRGYESSFESFVIYMRFCISILTAAMKATIGYQHTVLLFSYDANGKSTPTGLGSCHQVLHNLIHQATQPTFYMRGLTRDDPVAAQPNPSGLIRRFFGSIGGNASSVPTFLLTKAPVCS